jgi:hypothetical protein
MGNCRCVLAIVGVSACGVVQEDPGDLAIGSAAQTGAIIYVAGDLSPRNAAPVPWVAYTPAPLTASSTFALTAPPIADGANVKALVIDAGVADAGVLLTGASLQRNVGLTSSSTWTTVFDATTFAGLPCGPGCDVTLPRPIHGFGLVSMQVDPYHHGSFVLLVQNTSGGGVDQYVATTGDAGRSWALTFVPISVDFLSEANQPDIGVHYPVSLASCPGDGSVWITSHAHPALGGDAARLYTSGDRGRSFDAGVIVSGDGTPFADEDRLFAVPAGRSCELFLEEDYAPVLSVSKNGGASFQPASESAVVLLDPAGIQRLGDGTLEAFSGNLDAPHPDGRRFFTSEAYATELAKRAARHPTLATIELVNFHPPFAVAFERALATPRISVKTIEVPMQQWGFCDPEGA